jgi:hypothetical protein
LRNDPREKVNRYEDDGYAVVREELTRALTAWRARTGA